jgi:DNA-binding transcriptional MerR regulator
MKVRVLTTREVARESDTAEHRIRKYADLGLLECERTTDGVRIFGSDAPKKARAIKKERLLRRGRPRG